MLAWAWFCNIPVGAAYVPPGTATRIDGIVTTRSGKPLPHAVVYMLFYDPPAVTVTTDATGHFSWPVPTGELIYPHVPSHGDVSGEVNALPIDGTQWEPALFPAYSPYPTLTVSGTLNLNRQQCVVNWLSASAEPQLSIVVPDTGTVSSQIFGPDGKRLRNHAVEVNLPDLQASGAIVYRGRTDADGWIHLRLWAGAETLQVVAPGVGYGASGSYELLPGQSIVEPIPPLAPFASISGTVLPGAIKPGCYVSAGYIHPEDTWRINHCSVDIGGHFFFKDMLAGQTVIELYANASSLNRDSYAVVISSPGQNVKNVTVGKPETHYVSPFSPTKAADQHHPSVNGRVTTLTGLPVAGAKVYARAGVNDGHMFPETFLTATTDSDGRYSISNLPIGVERTGTGIELAVKLPGHAPAIGYAFSSMIGADRKTVPAIDVHDADLVVPGPGGALNVLVTRHGSPVPSSWVELTRDVDPRTMYEQSSAGDRSAASHEMRDILSPAVQTDASGVAHFVNIIPGLWQATAADTSDIQNLTLISNFWPRSFDFDFGEASAIAVKNGQSTNCAISIHPPHYDVGFKIVSSDGSPATGPEVGFDAKSGEANMFGPGLSVGPGGMGVYSFSHSGIWAVNANLHGSTQLPYLENFEPYGIAQSVVAVSPAIQTAASVALHAVHRNHGSILVSLLNELGRPVRGSISIESFSLNADYALSVGADGSAVFPSMPAGSYQLTATVVGEDVVTGFPMPSPLPADMSGKHYLPLQQTVTVSDGNTTEAVFKEQLGGYFHGVVRVPPGAKISDYYVSWPQNTIGVSGHYDPEKGTFACGPYPEGKITIYLFSKSTELLNYQRPAGSADVWITPGKIAQVVIEPGHFSLTAPESPESAEGDLENFPAKIAGHVKAPGSDGPCWGAQIAVLAPNVASPMLSATTDPRGQIISAPISYGYHPQQKDEPGSPSGVLVAAILPGEFGAAIAPYVPGQPVNLTLPTPINVSGRITTGGAVTDLGSSSVYVCAEYSGKGKLDDFLSVAVTAQPDGKFSLAGLTPGTYLIQAVRDGIWFSKSVKFVADENKPISTVDIDIPSPGAPMLLHVKSADGEPLVDTPVSFDIPNGPLTDSLWPKTFQTDGIGDLRFDGFTAGRQTMHFGGLHFRGSGVSGADCAG